MKRLLTVGFIVAYLGALNYGVVCHMLNYRTGSHPLMYFVVWDMFCGWIAYDTRVYVVGEGESQKYYDLTTPPWGEFHPWGTLGRQHYDSFNNHVARIAMNTLRHTQHEPMTRLLVVEESWAKKYNIPDKVWEMRYEEPKDPQKYYMVRTVLLPDGRVAHDSGSWVQQQAMKMLNDNPRLQLQARKSRSLFLMDSQMPGREMMVGPAGGNDYLKSFTSPIGSPLGN